MTYTPDTVSSLAESIEHFVSLGFKTIVSVPDYYGNWKYNDFVVLEEQVAKIFEKYNNDIKELSKEISLLDFSFFKKSKCSGGIISFKLALVGIFIHVAML